MTRYPENDTPPKKTHPTQEQLADAAGLTVRSIRSLERATVRYPRQQTVRLLADALGLSGPARADFQELGRAEYWNDRNDVGAGAAPAARDSDGDAADRVATDRVATDRDTTDRDTIDGDDLATVALEIRRPRAPAVPPAQLPPSPSGFAGRTGSVAELDSWLPADGAEPAVVAAVCGPAGVGKSALAVHWARRVRHRFTDGQLHLDLCGYSQNTELTPLEALGRVLRALGVAPDQIPTEITDATATYRTLTTEMRLLVVLDNARDADHARPLLPTGGGSMAIVTSRDTLTGLVAQEGAWRLCLPALTPTEATDLLVHVLGRARIAAEPTAVEELARLCAHLPLALRITAANLLDRPRTSLSAYCRELRSNRLAALDLGGSEDNGVRAAFALSYRSLPPAARRLFRFLGAAQVQKVTPAAAAALSGVDTRRAAGLLHRLTAAHLVERHEWGHAGLHDLLRAYAVEQSGLEDSEADRTQARQRMLAHYLSGARAASSMVFPEALRLPPALNLPVPTAFVFNGPEQALEWLDAECENLVAVIPAAADEGHHTTALCLADALRGYFQLHPHPTEWAVVVAAALAAARQAADPSHLALALLNVATLHLATDRYDVAIDALTQAVPVAAAAGWTSGQASIAFALGNAYRLTGQLDRSDAQLRQARILYRSDGSPDGEAVVLDELGLLAHERGELDRAADHLVRALRLHSGAGCGDRHLADTLLALGDVSRPLGRLDEALRYLTRALDLLRELGDQVGQAYTLRCLAEVHRDRGDYEQARDLANTAVANALEIADRRSHAQARQTQATIDLHFGLFADAVAGHQDALRLATEIGNQYTAAEALFGLAHARRHAGQLPEARAHAEEALSLARANGYRLLEADARRLLVDLRLGHDQRVAPARANRCRSAM